MRLLGEPQRALEVVALHSVHGQRVAFLSGRSVLRRALLLALGALGRRALGSVRAGVTAPQQPHLRASRLHVLIVWAELAHALQVGNRQLKFTALAEVDTAPK